MAPMMAAEILRPEHSRIVSIPCPIPSRNQVRVKVEGCGLCASSLPLWEGRPWFSYPLLPGTPGHEGWGIVNAVGPGVSSVSNGARVAFLSTNAFAQYDIAWEAEVVTLPAQLSSQPFPGEAIGCAMNIFRRADIRSCHTTAIVGIGFLGALLTQLASRAGSPGHSYIAQRFRSERGERIGGGDSICSGRRPSSSSDASD